MPIRDVFTVKGDNAPWLYAQPSIKLTSTSLIPTAITMAATP
jgi:hypothetical protein